MARLAQRRWALFSLVTGSAARIRVWYGIPTRSSSFSCVRVLYPFALDVEFGVLTVALLELTRGGAARAAVLVSPSSPTSDGGAHVPRQGL
jgi:hypothetical protein